MDRVCLIIIDSLRYDQTPSKFNPYRCRSLADTTEPSLATILSGLPPWEHGIVKTGQKDAGKLLEKIKERLLPSLYQTSLIASPAVLFHHYFTYSYSLNRMKDIAEVALKHEVEFMLLHPMDVHDLAVDIRDALRYYRGYEPIPEWVKSWRPRSGLRRPYQDLFEKGDAALLKALYKASVNKVFGEIAKLVNKHLYDWKILITADHGESMIYFHHDGVPDDVYSVPLLTHFVLEEKEYTHLDIYKILREMVG